MSEQSTAKFSLIITQLVVALILVVASWVFGSSSLGVATLLASLLMTLNLVGWTWLVRKIAGIAEIPRFKLAAVFLLKLSLLFGGFWVLASLLKMDILGLILGASTLPLSFLAQAFKF
ncbi:MAG: hypothetical protein HYU97_06045 [Deltaproteobacteria bacterium]|nr:hypothetical protein [Deltaproteobacteria bacterium]